MATQIAHRIALDAPTFNHDAQRADNGIGARMGAWIRHRLCSLHGHDNLMHFEKDRVFLQCASCGHETPGWVLTEAAPRIVLRGDARRHMLVRPHLVSARRIA